MTEKAVVKDRTVRHIYEPMKRSVWGILALFMELGSSAFSAAPSSAALAAGLNGANAFCAMIGGAFGALLHGFPAGFSGLGAVGIVLAARLIPEFGNAKLRAAVRTASAAMAVFFSRVAECSNVTELLSVIIAAIASAAFALCVNILSEETKQSGGKATFSETGNGKISALLCVVWTAVFMSFGALNYTYLNVGRTIVGFTALALSARKTLSRAAVSVVPSLCGICLSAQGEHIGAGAAVIVVSAMSSVIFSRRGKSIRAAGYVFFCAAAMLASGVDEGGYRILIEAAVSGGLFAALPVERMFVNSAPLSDKSAAAIIQERLNFAADAIAGIGSGITAAADVLDKKYALNPSEVADRAADRACRSCPNSMVCWGREYEMFRREFNRLIYQLRTGFEITEFSLSPECSEICVNKNGVIKAVNLEYSRYISAMSDERRVRELRRVYTDQLAGLRDILIDMGSMNANSVSERDRAAEKRAEKILADNGMEAPQAFVLQGNHGKARFEAYGATEPRVSRERLGQMLSRAIGVDLELPEIGGSPERFRVTAAERTRFSAKIGAYQLARGDNRVCGDCYDSFTGADGILYVVLSDGMGTGSRAKVDSAMACSVLSKLLKSGIALSAALETVNTVLMVKSADESFATLDICKIDLDSGECAVYKAGAATTYIKSDERLIRAALSSPPAGTGGKLTVPAQKFKVGKGDIIVMMTDGAAPDEQWLSRELSRHSDPAELSECIAKAARSSGNRDDDISVVSVVVGS